MARVWDHLLHNASGTQVAFAVVFFGIAITIAVVGIANSRKRRRVRRLGAGIFVVGSPGVAAQDMSFFNQPTWSPNPYEIGKFNPINGRVNDGSPQDHEMPAVGGI